MKSASTVGSMARGLIMLLVLCLSAQAGDKPSAKAGVLASAQKWWVYVGTYTRGESKGIYRCTLDAASGRVSDPELVAEISNPSFLVVHPNGRLLYAVNELGRFGGKPVGGVSGFRIASDTGRLKPINQQPSGGAGPCHVNTDATGRWVLVANYGGGSVSVFPIDPDGRLEAASSFIQHHGSSVNPRRQQGPHAHGIYPDPQNRFVLVPDLGLDKVLVYRFDAAKGVLSPNDPPAAKLAPGAGPRHLAFHPNGRFVYVVNELHCTVTVFAYDAERGVLAERQTISTLPKDFSGQNTDAEIAVHPTGRFVYASNRGHDSVAVFAVNGDNGRLRLIQHVSTQGRTPRHFALDPTGRFLLAANQNSDTIVVFGVNAENGRLEATGQVVSVPSPVCLVFRPAS